MKHEPDPVVVIEKITKCYGKNEVLRGLTFTISAGEFFGLIGPNGAGKTTFIDILAGVEEADAGRILIDGEDSRTNPLGVKAKLGYVPQSIALYPTLNARDNLVFFAKLQGLPKRRITERLDAVLDVVGLKRHAGQRVAEFSHGMKQRLNIAAGIVHEPAIVILDEPTAGLDAESREALLNVLGRINKTGATILYTTHYIEEAERLCSRVAVLDAGRLIALDTPRDLIRNFGAGIVRIELEEAPDDSLLAQIGRLGFLTVADNQDRHITLETPDPKNAVRSLFELADRKSVSFKRMDIVQPNLETAVNRLIKRCAAL